MVALAQGETVDCSNPQLDLFTSINLVLTDIAELEFTIADSLDVQIFPPTGRSVLDPTTDCPTGERLGVGHNAAVWTVPVAQAFGTYKINWFFKLTPTSPETAFTEEFEIVSVVGSAFDGYASIQDMRDEGFTDPPHTDARLAKLIDIESRRVDRLTGQWFSPRSGTMILDGRGSKALRFPVPIISVTEIRLDGDIVDLTAFEIYNRHLAGIFFPDDRSDPRIILNASASPFPNPAFPSPVWPDGHQNIEIDGVWGYTDPPGPVGITPQLINLATKLLVVKQLGLLSDMGSRADARLRAYIKSEETENQKYQLDTDLMRGGAWGYSLTGDPEVDEILISFMSPLSMGDTGGLDGGRFRNATF